MNTSQTQSTTPYGGEPYVYTSNVSHGSQGGAGTNLAGSYTSPQKTEVYTSSYEANPIGGTTSYTYTQEIKTSTYENPVKTSYVSTSGVAGTGAYENPVKTSYVSTSGVAGTGAYENPVQTSYVSTSGIVGERTYENPVSTSYVSTSGNAAAGQGYTATSGVQGDINSILASIGGATGASGTYTTTTYTTTTQQQPATYTYSTQSTQQQPATYTYSTQTTQQPVTYTSGYIPATGNLASSQTIPITTQSVTYTVRDVTQGTNAQSGYLAGSGEVNKQSRLATSNVARLSQLPRQNLLSPYRVTMYPEFELVDDIPDRKNLVDSINLLLQKSSDKETLLVSPSRLSIKRQSILSPAEIEFESLLKIKEEDGSIYEGQGKDGRKHGKGKLTYRDGRVFEGEFNHGKAEGTGILRFKTGKVCYEGGFDGNEFQGQGTLQCETPIPLNGGFDYNNFDNIGNHWTKYEGEFKDGKKHGNGTLYLTNGEKFTGEWRDDKVSGRGSFEQRTGGTVQGYWSDNRFSQAL